VNPGLAESASGEPAGASLPQPGLPGTQVVMNGEPLIRTVTINEPQGLHMRPAAAFAKAARQYQSTVTLRVEDRSVNGKSPLDLMLLAAEPGARLVLEVSGEDAPAALAALAELIESVVADGENDSGTPPPKG
jgi:phosphotransferase system HPr (HPr) family protein